MARLSNTAMSTMTQGKFIRSADSRTLHGQARILRAEAIRRTVQTVGASLRAWLGRVPSAASA
jgi:hypothetical protein